MRRIVVLLVVGGCRSSAPSSPEASVEPPLRTSEIPPVDLADAEVDAAFDITPAQAASFEALGRKIPGPTGNVRIGAVSSTVPIANASAKVAALRPRIRACYQKGLYVDPFNHGDVVMNVKVSTAGAAVEATPASNTGVHPQVVACVAASFRLVTFDAPKAEATLTVPLTFVE